MRLNQSGKLRCRRCRLREPGGLTTSGNQGIAMSDTTTTSSFVIEATAQNFQQDVIERSHSRSGRDRLLGHVVRSVPHARPGPGKAGAGV